MNKIIKVYKEELPKLRFIGKKYNDYSHWPEWFQNGWFDKIEEALDKDNNILDIWKDGNGYVGIEFKKDDNLKEYWIGMFSPFDIKVPEGFDSFEIIDQKIGVCWLYGKENEVHDTSDCLKVLKDNNMEPLIDESGRKISFENCLCPRYTTPDDEGNVILDYCYFVK